MLWDHADNLTFIIIDEEWKASTYYVMRYHVSGTMVKRLTEDYTIMTAAQMKQQSIEDGGGDGAGGAGEGGEFKKNAGMLVGKLEPVLTAPGDSDLDVASTVLPSDVANVCLLVNGNLIWQTDQGLLDVLTLKSHSALHIGQNFSGADTAVLVR